VKTLQTAEIPGSHLDLVEAAGFAHLATSGGQGWPQSTPMWYLWDGEHLLFSTLKSRQKYRNLDANRRVAISIVDPVNPYRYLQIRGVASLEDDADGAVINDLVKKYVGSSVSQWDEPGGERVVVKVRPVRVSSFG
jgi:PPOX class probable F420-dependent enzyme